MKKIVKHIKLLVVLFPLFLASTLFASENLHLDSINQELLEKAKFSNVNILETDDEDRFIDPSTSIFDLFIPQKIIGKGTYSEVYQCHDSNQNVYAIKKYSVTDRTASWLMDWGISPKEFVFQVAKKEFEIGIQLSHPNIITIHNIAFKETPDHIEAYLIMDCVQGAPFRVFSDYSEASKKYFLLQFLDAIEYTLDQGIIPDDIWSENVMVSSGEQKLTLIDLGGYEIADQEDLLPFQHYYEQILYMIEQISEGLDTPRFQQQLTTWKTEVFSNIDHEKPLTNLHLILLQEWIRSLKQSFGETTIQPHTIHLSSKEEIFSKYQTQVEKYPNHISFATGQAEKFLAYELIARTVFQKFRPEGSLNMAMKNLCLLRYPSKHAPKDLNQQFERFPLREDYDTASVNVANYLISASPSLNEDEEDESAIAIFRKNDRDEIFEDFIFEIFREESLLPSLFENRVEQLLGDFPVSKKGMVLTQVFLPKAAPIHKAVYRSHAYGIPFGGIDHVEKVKAFFEEYSAGSKWPEDPNPQLRFLPSALKKENGFHPDHVHMVRYTLVTSEELQKYAAKVEKVVSEIFNDFRKSRFHLAKQLFEAVGLDDQDEKDLSLDELSLQYRKRSDPVTALKLAQMISDPYARKPVCITLAVSGLVEHQECELAEQVVFTESDHLLEKEKILAQIAFVYLDHGNLKKIKEI